MHSRYGRHAHTIQFCIVQINKECPHKCLSHVSVFSDAAIPVIATDQCMTPWKQVPKFDRQIQYGAQVGLGEVIEASPKLLIQTDGFSFEVGNANFKSQVSPSPSQDQQKQPAQRTLSGLVVQCPSNVQQVNHPMQVPK